MKSKNKADRTFSYTRASYKKHDIFKVSRKRPLPKIADHEATTFRPLSHLGDFKQIKMYSVFSSTTVARLKILVVCLAFVSYYVKACASAALLRC